MAETEQPKNIEWYEAQVAELKAIRKAYLELCEGTNDDAYFPDLIRKELQELRDIKEQKKRAAYTERMSPKHFPKSWGY